MNDSDVSAFGSFTATHPELWALIGEAWRSRDPVNADYFTGLRDAVCIVGKFDLGEFERQCVEVFG